MKRLALAFPWIVLVGVAGAVVWDQLRPREGTGQTASIARDPVCHMDVRPATSFPLHHEGVSYYFCTETCRDAFTAAPVGVPKTHTMRGIPTWMYQAAVAVVLIVSFGLFGLLPSGSMEARVTVPIARLLRWPPLRTIASAVTVAIFLLIIAAGLFGNQNPAMNIAPLLTWTIWWAGLVFLVLYAGKAWCYVCPWDAIASWVGRGRGLGLRWPMFMRNIWPAILLFVLLTWIELGLGITLIPRATAYVALGMLALAVVSGFLFDRKSFCRYGCLVGRISGLYALFASTEVRADTSACASCATMDCYRGNARGDGCPTFEFPKTMKLSTYCTMCSECFKSCPHEAMSVRLRPWGADLVQEGRPRTDEAILAIILLALTGFHGLTMTPAWGEWTAVAPFGALMIAIMALPAALFWLLARLSAVWSRQSTWTLFVRYAYALLPIALFYHLAHNAEHFLMEGPKALALASDPFGWGWDLFGTATTTFPPMVTLGGLWGIQVFFVIVGHLYGLWISERTTRRLVPEKRRAFLAQLPMLAAMVLFSTFSLWLLHQPMEMRVSAM